MAPSVDSFVVATILADFRSSSRYVYHRGSKFLSSQRNLNARCSVKWKIILRERERERERERDSEGEGAGVTDL